MPNLLKTFGIALALAQPIGIPPQAPSEITEFNTIVMNATFEILGPTANPKEVTCGTGFLMGIPTADDPTVAKYVLVTAAHVLDGVVGSSATLKLRVREGGAVVAMNWQVPIRNTLGRLYVKHPEADVAAIYVNLPKNVEAAPIPPSFLANDAKFEELEIHPGDQMFTAGYPYCMQANDQGFAFLRSGSVASYPLTPATKVKNFLLDLPAFGGNSGGAVYVSFVNRMMRKNIQLGRVDQYITGILIQSSTDKTFGVAVILPAQMISETLAMLAK